jgi:hypothetical protein
MPDQFDAFISYRRSDASSFAQTLRRALQDFRPPKALRGKARPLKIYVDTIYERATQDFYEKVTRPARLASRHLLVVATPGAADRGPAHEDWIRREIQDFEAGLNGGNIAVVVARDLNGRPLPGDIAARYPNVELIDLRGLNALSFLNPIRSARLAEEMAKILAVLLGVEADEMPVLRREQERRQQVRLGLSAGSATAVVTAVAILSVWALRSRNDAIDALTRSTFATDRVIQSVAASLEAGEVRTNLLTTSCDLLDSLGSRTAGTQSAGARVVCAVERAVSRDKQNEPEQAEAILREAVDLAETSFARTKNPDAALAAIEARKASLTRRARSGDAAAELQMLVGSARTICETFPNEAESPNAVADALQTQAVESGDVNPQFALAAADAANDFRRMALTRSGEPSTALANVAGLMLKAELHRRLRQEAKASETTEEARTALGRLTSESAASAGLDERYRQLKEALGDRPR